MYGAIDIEEPKNIDAAVISRRQVFIRSVRGIMIGTRKLLLSVFDGGIAQPISQYIVYCTMTIHVWKCRLRLWIQIQIVIRVFYATDSIMV